MLDKEKLLKEYELILRNKEIALNQPEKVSLILLIANHKERNG